jgi:clan AA aspartic protease (TIGR02281 family)
MKPTLSGHLSRVLFAAALGCFTIGMIAVFVCPIGPEKQQPTQILMAALDPLFKGQVALSSVSRSHGAPVMVPLERDERALMLHATLDNQQTSTLILDTGATYTSISQELAQSLGYDLEHSPRVSITTANGQVLLPKVTLRSLTLNGYTAYNVEATVMPMPKNVPFSGLLGLSFIKNHRVTIDSAADHLVIEPQAG